MVSNHFNLHSHFLHHILYSSFWTQPTVEVNAVGVKPEVSTIIYKHLEGMPSYRGEDILKRWAEDEKRRAEEILSAEVGTPSPTVGTFSQIIAEECKGTSLDPQLVEALIQVESGGNPLAIGDEGRAIGLGQIHPKWHRDRMARLGVTDLFEPRQNIKVIVDILEELLNKYGNIEAALTAYNAGHDTGDRAYANKIYQEIENLKFVGERK